MSSKKRPSAARARPAAVGGVLSPEARARQALDTRHFREAIEHYKTLLKQERRVEWLDGLADSYAGRAAELADKGMLSEALVVWRNRASLCGRPLAEGPYLGWLLRAGEHDAALALLTADGLSATAAAELETGLAAVVLTSPDSALARLAADSPLFRQRPIALAAIAACCRGDQTELEQHLRAIPFRSPYRDLRFILKALSVVGSDPAQAAGLIGRAVVAGPFEGLAAVVRAAILPGSRWLAAMPALDDEGRQLLLDLKGCPEDRRSVLFDLARLGSTPPPAKVVELLLRRHRGLPASVATLCRRLLPYAQQRMSEYQGAFGPLTEGEQECIAALAAEHQGDSRLSRAHWLRAAEWYSPPEKEPLQAALILRRLFEVFVGDAERADPDAECIDWLQRSLALDPDDLATYLKVIRIHRQGRDLRAARAMVDRALARFANDPAVLLEAVEVALAGNAFKKAVTLAKRLLELDPINSRVRALIGQAHVSHARKQIRAKRPDAAAKELALAEQWLISADERSVVKLLRGLSATDQTASALLSDVVRELGGQLLAAFHLLLECARVGIPAPATLRRAGIDLSGKPNASEVLAVAHALNTLREEPRALRTLLDSLRAPLRRAAGEDFSESERVSICEALLRWDERSLLQAYADVGLKRWPARPIFVYFTTFARHGARAYFVISVREETALARALDQAQDDGDQRTALRIRGLIEPPERFHSCPTGDSDDWGDLEDAFADLGNGLPLDPRAVLEMMLGMAGEEQVISMAREGFSASEFRQLERAAGGNRKKLARLLVEAVGDRVERRAADLPSDPLPPPPAAPPPRLAPRRKPPAPPVQPVHDDRQKDLFDD